MESQKIKKINFGYLLGYILIPIIICAICFTIGALFFPEGTMAVILYMVPVFVSVIWWVFGGNFIFKKKRNLFEAKLDQEGFKRNQTFYADGSMIVVDIENGKIGALFFGIHSKLLCYQLIVSLMYVLMMDVVELVLWKVVVE